MKTTNFDRGWKTTEIQKHQQRIVVLKKWKTSHRHRQSVYIDACSLKNKRQIKHVTKRKGKFYKRKRMGVNQREDQKDKTEGDRRRDSVEDEESEIEERKCETQ